MAQVVAVLILIIDTDTKEITGISTPSLLACTLQQERFFVLTQSVLHCLSVVM